MKIPFLFLVLLALVLNSCSSSRPKTKPVVKSSTPAAIVTPDFSLAAKVISVNTVGRFVVLSFPSGTLPKIDQTMFLYRGGLKVAELRVTGPQQESNIVADITSGEAQVGDTVSEK
jgi:hypothetical protein